MTQITLTSEEADALRGALSCYVSDLRMEIADTDSWQFRQNLKHEEVLLKKLIQQLDPEWASLGASSSPGDSTMARSGGDAPRPVILPDSDPDIIPDIPPIRSHGPCWR